MMRFRQGMLLGVLSVLTMSQMPPMLSIGLNSTVGNDTQSSKRGGRRGNKAFMRASQKRKQKLRAKKVIKNKRAKNRR